jgi:small nuclear ribonucleoprotein (snRNP)-like protein
MSQGEDDQHKKLDVTSEQFDPEECLGVTDPSKVSIPFPNVTELKSFRQCMNLVPPAVRGEVRESLGLDPVLCPISFGTSAEHDLSRQFLVDAQEKTAEQKQRDVEKKAFMCQRAAHYMSVVQKAATTDPIETIVKRVRKGPLMMLKRAYVSGCQIDITTRHPRGVRGIMRATLHGFDKYMNMLLADAHEMFVVRQRVTRPKPAVGSWRCSADGTQGEACMRSCWKQELRQRMLARILLRGDQVVTITFASGPLRMPGCLAHVVKEPGEKVAS